MRVLIVTSEFSPRMGGIERYVDDMASALSALADVGLIVGPGQHAQEGRRYSSLGELNLAYPTSDSEFQEVSNVLWRLTLQYDADVVHLANAGLAVYARGLIGLLPVFATVHCKDLTRPWQQVPGSNVQKLIREGLSVCERVFCVSQFTAELVHARAPKAHIQVVTPALSLQLISCLQSLAAARPASKGRVHIVSAGKIVRRKGHEHLLKILENMDRAVRWTIVGDGPFKDQLRTSIEKSPLRDHVQMLGAVDDMSMWHLMGSADLFALTPIELYDCQGLDAEGFGLVFIEAAALGTPSIGSIYGGCRDAIRQETGLLVDPLDPSAAARIIDGFLSQGREHCGEMAERRRVAREDYRWDDRAAMFMAAYQCGLRG